MSSSDVRATDRGRGPNQYLIGVPGGRDRLSTPALVLDLDAFEQNIAAMAALSRRSRIALRPHAKAHKSIEVARRQVAAGAIGISCATLGEAETMGRAGIPGVLVTSPVIGDSMVARLAALHRDIDGLAVVADHPRQVAALAPAVASTGKPLAVLVDIDVGQHRTGVQTVDDAVGLARAIAQAPALRFAGVQAYYGHLQQVEGFGPRQAAVREQLARLRTFCAALREAGLPPDIVTGGGTGSAAIDAAEQVHTEIQPGSYLFMDSSYGRPSLWPENASPFRVSLFVRAAVVSANRPDCAVVNAGIKSLATDSGTPRVAAGGPVDAIYKFMGDEHGALQYQSAGDGRLAVGDEVELIVSHCDPTVNLYDVFHCVRGRDLVDIWPIDARGR
jgi:D-serine deaminase-like pyridoxal phosphate-dependent protein